MAQRKRVQENMFMGPMMGVGQQAQAALRNPGRPASQGGGMNPFKAKGQAGAPPQAGQGAMPMMGGASPMMAGMPQMPPPPQLPPTTGDEMVETQGSVGGNPDMSALMEMMKMMGMGGKKAL